MTKDIFFAHKQGIEENMKENLIFAKATGKPAKKYCYEEEKIIVTVVKECTDSEYGDRIEEVYQYGLLYGKPDITFVTETPHCITKTIGTRYVFKVPKLRSEITEEMVSYRMKKLVRKQLRLTTYEHIECKVLALFKEGKISWDMVKEQHGKGCSV